jgi:hypothetical protein
LEFGLFCSCLADSLPIGRGWSTWTQLALCSSCSSLVLERLIFDPFFPAVFSCRVFGGRSACGLRTVRVGCVGRGQSEVSAQTVRYWGCSTGGSRVIFGRSTAAPRTVCLGSADGPLGACGRSARCLQTVHPVLRRAAKSFGVYS